MSDVGSSDGYRSRFQKAMLRAVVAKRRAIDVSVSPRATTYETGDGEPAAEGEEDEAGEDDGDGPMPDDPGGATDADGARDPDVASDGSSVTVERSDDGGATSQAARMAATATMPAANVAAARTLQVVPLRVVPLRSPMVPM